MTRLQNMAINEMWRQGLHIWANRAERCWHAGREFSLDASISVPTELRHRLVQCNRDAVDQERCA